jgi:hypothetical protein
LPDGFCRLLPPQDPKKAGPLIGTGVCPGRPWRGSWLKVALGKLATERTVPLDAPSMGTEYAFGRARRSQTLVQIRGPYAVRITAHKVAWDGMAAPIPLPKSDRLWRPANTFSKSALPRQLPSFQLRPRRCCHLIEQIIATSLHTATQSTMTVSSGGWISRPTGHCPGRVARSPFRDAAFAKPWSIGARRTVEYA